jgi:hypothetical protein
MADAVVPMGHHGPVTSTRPAAARLVSGAGGDGDRPARPTNWVRSIAAGTAFVVAAVTALLVRQPGQPSWDTVWAEDGRIFTHDALTQPAVQTLMRAYAGYAQFATRALALGTRVVPIDAAAAYLATSAAVVAALLGLVVVRSARSWVTSPWLRWSLGIMVVIAPVTFSELNTAITNVAWPLLVAGFWAIASREEGRFDTPVRVLTVLVGGLSTATQAVLLPWAVVVAVRRRRRSDVLVLGALVAGLGLQAVAASAATQQTTESTRDAVDLVELFGLRVLGSLVVGERWIAHLSTTAAIRVGLGSLAVVLVVALLARPSRLDVDRRIFVGAAVLTALACFVITVWYRGTSSVDLSVREGAVLSSARYAYLPVLLIFSALVVMVDRSGRRWLRAVLLVQAAVVIATSFALTNPRSDGPTWASAVRDARAICRADPTLLTVELPIAPPPVWSVGISCERLR